MLYVTESSTGSAFAKFLCRLRGEVREKSPDNAVSIFESQPRCHDLPTAGLPCPQAAVSPVQRT